MKTTSIFNLLERQALSCRALDTFRWSFLLACLLAFQPGLFAQTFTATVEQPVPDDGTPIAFEIAVSGLPDAINTDFGLVQVCLNMNHSWNSDMDVRLIAPGGTSFLLFAGIGGDGDNWQDCCLRDDAPTSVGNASPPYTGVFRPMGAMGNVNNGQNPNGIWKILLLDTYAFADAGYFKDWSISFGAGAPGPVVFPGTHLPLVHILTGGQTIPNEPKILADLHIINKGNGQLNTLADTVFDYKGKILVELQGYTGPWYPKKNYDFDLLDDAGLEIDTSLLGLPAENDWILKAEYLDPTLMSNALAYSFARRMGRYAPRTMYCEVFLDGDYLGVYNLTEKVKRDNNRVDIAKLNPEDVAGDELTGGYIIEMNHNGAPGAWDSQYLPVNFSTCNLPVQYKYVEPRSSEIMPAQAQYIRAYVDSFELSLHQPDFADPVQGYRKWVDESSFIDFMFVNEFSTNYDSYGRSTFMYKEKITDGGKLKIGPAWDYDRGFCCVDGWVWELTHTGWPFPDWWSIMHTDPVFLQQRYCRWQELREGPWTTDAFLEMVDSLHQLLAEPAARNFLRWPELNYADFDGNVAARKALIADRLDWMDAQITEQSCELVSATTTTSSSSDWQLYPNPASALVQVTIGQDYGPVSLEIHDLNGKLVFFKTLPAGQQSLEVAVDKWPPGMYWVAIVGEHGRSVRRLVVTPR